MALCAALVAFGVWLWVAEPGGSKGDARPLTVLRPADGATVPDSVELIFQTDAPLRNSPMGWMAGSLHLHAVIDGREIMPAAADIREIGTGRYRWTLPPLGEGDHVLRLYWAGLDHRAVPEGASNAVRLVGDPDSRRPAPDDRESATDR